MSKSLYKKVSDIADRLSKSNCKIPKVVVISKGRAEDNINNQWIISEYYKTDAKKDIYTNNTLYANDYHTYLDNLHQIETKSKARADIIVFDF